MCLSASQVEAPGNATAATLGPLSSSTTYSVRVTCLYPTGGSSTLTGRLTTREGAEVGVGVPRPASSLPDGWFELTCWPRCLLCAVLSWVGIYTQARAMWGVALTQGTEC